MFKIMLVIFSVFLVWMLFFHESSYLNNRKLKKEIDALETELNYYKDGISKDQKMIKDLNTPDSLTKYAREKYKMKKENEEIFLIEFDTIK
jgi:cell division protein FtsB